METKPAISSRLLKWSLGAVGAMLLAAGTAVASFNFEMLAAGDYWELKRLGGAALMAAGTGLFGFIKTFWGEVSAEDFQALLSQIRPKADAPLDVEASE